MAQMRPQNYCLVSGRSVGCGCSLLYYLVGLSLPSLSASFHLTCFIILDTIVLNKLAKGSKNNKNIHKEREGEENCFTIDDVSVSTQQHGRAERRISKLKLYIGSFDQAPFHSAINLLFYF